MVQEFSVKNFLSFKDEVTLSFLATKDTRFEDYQVVEVAPNVRLLRFGVIFGANASGKSNVLKAFGFLQKFLTKIPRGKTEKTNVVPFLLNDRTPIEPTEFALKFYIGSTKYWYKLSLDASKVVRETLFFYKSVQPTMLFDRTFDEGVSVVKFNPAVIKLSATIQEEISLKCLPNMSLFGAISQVNINISQVTDVINWILNNITPIITPDSDLFEYAERSLVEDSSLKDYILDFTKRADFNIDNIAMVKQEKKLPDDFVKTILSDTNAPEDLKEKIRTNPISIEHKTFFVHRVKEAGKDKDYLLSSNLQSSGTRRMLGLEAALYNTKKAEVFMTIDEIESSLHPELVEFILVNFLQEKNRSQLLITTHYDPLLNKIDDIFRKDSVWFTEKSETGSTELYSLVEFKGLNRITSFQSSYRNGNFGALPNVR